MFQRPCQLSPESAQAQGPGSGLAKMAQTTMGLCDKELEFGALNAQTGRTRQFPFDVACDRGVCGSRISQQSELANGYDKDSQ